MEERCFGPIRFIPGENRGKYPFCHSLYIDGEGILIDPASDRDRLKRLRTEDGVKQVWLSHWHEDHFMHLDLFDDVPLLISEQDAPQLSDVELFLDGYGIKIEDQRRVWREIVTSQFHFRPRKPAEFLEAGKKIRLKDLTVEIIPTPGHTPGHLCFFFQEHGVLFLGDYDLTPFGPWYGDRDSSIQDTIQSVERLKEIPAKIWLTCHETGVFEENPAVLWDQYLAVIDQRESKLLDYLNTPKTIADIVEAWIVYQRPREPKEFYALAEEMIMQKHLDLLVAKSKVVKEGERYRRLK
jgi:glyoxylase-like metal-dependent hydrolase (beta-lactamase superfamily II)